MSNNIIYSDYNCGRLTIESVVARNFYQTHKQNFPECHFVDDIDWEMDYTALIKNMHWNGECSGRSFDLLKQLLALTRDWADLVFVFESGDFVGLRVRDGVVTEHSIRMVLEE